MRTFIKVVRYHVNGDAVDDTQPVTAALQTVFQQIIREVACATFPANRLPGVVHHLTVKERFFRNRNIINVGIEIDRTRIVTHQQRFDNCPAQMRGRFCPGDSFDSNRTVIEVDVAAGLILIGVFHVVLRTSDHHLFEAPDVLNIVGKLPHQNIKTVGIFDPGFVIGIAFFGRRTGDEQRRNQSQREIFFHHSGCVLCLFLCKLPEACSGTVFIFYLPAYSPRYAPLYPRTGS